MLLFGLSRHKVDYKMWLISLIVFGTFVSSVQSLAVMSVDLGTEFMKVAVVSVSSILNKSLLL